MNANVRKPLSQSMASKSNIDRRSDKHNRHLNADSVELQHVENEANFPPCISVDAEVHLEPGTQPDRVADNLNWKQNSGCREQVTQGDIIRIIRPQTVDYNEDGSMYVNFLEKRHSVPRHNLPPVTSNNGDGYLVPVTEAAALKESVSGKESSRHLDQVSLCEDNPQSNEDYREDNVYMSVEDVRASTVSEAVGVLPSVADKQPVVTLWSETVNKEWTDVDTAAEIVPAVPLYDSINEGKIRDAQRRKSTDKRFYHMQPAFSRSLSLGEVITDTLGTSAWTDLDTAAESVAAMPVYDSVREGKIGDARRRKSTDKSLYPVWSSFGPSVSNGEVIINAEGNVDLLQAEGQSVAHNSPSSASTKTVEQATLNPGS